MRHRIVSFAVHKTAVTVALIYLALGLLYVPLMYLAGSLSPSDEAGRGLSLYLPISMLLIGYVATAFFCLVYNLIAKKAGGIEFNVELTSK